MHSIKWVVHLCKNQGNKRDRELPEKWAQKLYFYASTKKKVTFAKSYPKWPVARVISYLINSNLSFISYHLKTTSSPQCIQIIVSDAQWPFHIVQLSQTSDLRTMMLFTRMASLKVMSTSFDTVEDNTKIICQMDTQPCLQTESLKQECPPALILDQTARPFRVKKNGLQGHCKST